MVMLILLLTLLLATASMTQSQKCSLCKSVKDGGQLDGEYWLYMEDKDLCPTSCIYTKEESEGPDYFCFYPSEDTYTTPCPDSKCSDMCPTLWDPVCGLDGETYSNKCQACPVGVACGGECPCQGIMTTSDSKCSDVCTTEYEPVCGLDGKTYGNKCQACQIEIGVACEGTCPCIGETTAGAEVNTTKNGDQTLPPSHCKCGVKKLTRIVGGKQTQVNEYLWMVSLQKENRHLCGAALISSQWVVTAAHCFYDGSGNLVITKPNQIQAVIGEHDLYKDQEHLRKSLPVSKIVRHSEYDFASNMNDITLLKLVNEVDLGVYTPVCLPEPKADFTGKDAWVYGWGSLSSGGASPSKLQELEVPIVDDSTCSEAFKRGTGNTLSDAQLSVMVCAGGVEGKDACQGDSGGPLSHEYKGQHQLVGVVSWGYGCAIKGLFGVYTEVAVLRIWIDQTIEKNGGANYCK